MTTYNIYFTNNYTKPGENQDYAFFCEAPKVTTNSAAPTVYSNVFLTNTLAQGAYWSIDITKNYFAWCGTSLQPLKENVKVNVGMAKLATLGTTSSPGSTFTMYNNSGSPAFQPTTTYTADASSYEIDTGTDFTPNMNFLIGLGGTDSAGRTKPLATIAAPGNAMVNITPVTRFYIAAYSASTGTTINTKAASKVAALIDFTANPGMFAAIVSQDQTGAFTVNYTSAAAFTLAVAASQPVQQRYSLQLTQMRRQIDQLQRLIESALDVHTTANSWYSCTATWQQNPTDSQKLAILNAAKASMTASGYSYEGGGIIGKLLETVSHTPPHTLATTVLDWKSAIFALPDNLRFYVVDPRVVPVSASDATAESSDASEEVTTHENGGVESGSGGHTNGSTYGGDVAAKKRRALQLLEAEGLGDYGSSLNISA